MKFTFLIIVVVIRLMRGLGGGWRDDSSGHPGIGTGIGRNEVVKIPNVVLFNDVHA